MIQFKAHFKCGWTVNIMAENKTKALEIAKVSWPNREVERIRKVHEVQRNKVQFTFGGRNEAGHRNERLDCTVRALKFALDIGYGSAHSLMAAFGRKPGQGFQFHRWARMDAGAHLMNVIFEREKRMTVGAFIRKNPKGTFILGVPRHVFTVKDGVIYDTHYTGPKTQLYSAYEIIV